MSAFLGPIHHRMFGKALAVDALARQIARHSDERGWTDGHGAALDRACPRLEGEITDHIDLSQIHASLNTLVVGSEEALSFAMEPVASHLDELLVYVASLGEDAGLRFAGSDVRQIWNAMDEAWLDGMPCDGFMSFGENEEDRISWSIALEPHPAAGYAQLRRAWMQGFCRAAGVDFLADADNAFRISKEA